MVSREDCVIAINKFIKTQHLDDTLTLFIHLCDIRDVHHKEEIVNFIANNAPLLSLSVLNIIDALCVHLEINKVTDKNNTLIKVY